MEPEDRVRIESFAKLVGSEPLQGTANGVVSITDSVVRGAATGVVVTTGLSREYDCGGPIPVAVLKSLPSGPVDVKWSREQIEIRRGRSRRIVVRTAAAIPLMPDVPTDGWRGVESQTRIMTGLKAIFNVSSGGSRNQPWFGNVMVGPGLSQIIGGSELELIRLGSLDQTDSIAISGTSLMTALKTIPHDDLECAVSSHGVFLRAGSWSAYVAASIHTLPRLLVDVVIREPRGERYRFDVDRLVPAVRSVGRLSPLAALRRTGLVAIDGPIRVSSPIPMHDLPECIVPVKTLEQLISNRSDPEIIDMVVSGSPPNRITCDGPDFRFMAQTHAPGREYR